MPLVQALPGFKGSSGKDVGRRQTCPGGGHPRARDTRGKPGSQSGHLPSGHLTGPRVRRAGAHGHRAAHVDVELILVRLDLVGILLCERRQVERKP